ncbi:MAG: OmpA family protein [Prevotella sp.]|nr:OmpA family protein [Prevotella sp.]MBS7208050.1 OmpA family protein [Prevotella sp.]
MKKAVYIIVCLLLTAVAAGCRTPKLSEADAQFQRGEYYDASVTYKKVYNKLRKKEERPQRGEVAFKMGRCYRLLNMSARASAAFQNALRYEYPDSTTHFMLAQALHADGKYAAALRSYDKYLEFCPDDSLAINCAEGCRTAQEIRAHGSRYVVKQAKLFNSRRADFCPMYLGADCDQIYYTSTTEKATGDKKSEITGMKNADVFFSKKNEKGEWERPEPVEGELNTEFDEGIVAFSPDAQTMYLTKARRELNAPTSVEIYTSTRSDAKWSAPVKFEITADTLSTFGHPAVSPDGEYLYFVSDMPGGYGGKDIWRISLKERQGSLVNLGPDINTEGNDDFPYVRSDGSLYFSSDGHPGMGGLDIFRATAVDDPADLRWKVENMGFPINSAGDDFGITFGKGEDGFFSSNRGDARGYDHIYSFEYDPVRITIEGLVMDKDEEPVKNAIIRIVGNDGSNQKEVARDDGSFSFALQRGVKYVMLAGAKGYLNQKQEFASDSTMEDANYWVEFILPSISKPSVVENIFYDYDKADLRPESKTALNELIAVLHDNPNVTIEMASHTDRWGSDAYNINLSERRAKSVVDYLVENGISRNRLQPHGYGKSRPKTVTKRIARLYPQFKEGDILTEEFIKTLSEEDQQAADQINRRTEFSVLSLTYNMK